VWGESTATNGSGGTGVAGIGPGIGVWGTSFTENGNGVQGSAAAQTGAGAGVIGYTHAPFGRGAVGGVLNLAPTTIGVLGYAPTGTGVFGWVHNGGAMAAVSKTGVYGQCDLDNSSIGVYGRSSTGIGVRGRTNAGIGVYAQATGATGTALRVSGKAVFNRSGKAKVLAGNLSVQVTSVTLTSSSLVLATIQGAGAAGVYVRNVALNVGSSSFTIRLSQAVAADTNVAWFIVN
jgi:hypothetical protein